MIRILGEVDPVVVPRAVWINTNNNKGIGHMTDRRNLRHLHRTNAEVAMLSITIVAAVVGITLTIATHQAIRVAICHRTTLAPPPLLPHRTRTIVETREWITDTLLAKRHPIMAAEIRLHRAKWIHHVTAKTNWTTHVVNHVIRVPRRDHHVATSARRGAITTTVTTTLLITLRAKTAIPPSNGIRIIAEAEMTHVTHGHTR